MWWNLQRYRYYKHIQTILQEALITKNREQWHKFILNVSSNTYTDPTTFWKKIKLITGKREQEPHYIKDKSNIKLYTNEDKETLHRKYWQEIFNGQEEEEEEDNNTETILQHIQNNIKCNF